MSHHRGINECVYLGFSLRALQAHNRYWEVPLEQTHSARKIPSSSNRRNWALILAGGEGTRLQDLTRSIAGDFRPKQFCPLFGGKTLLRHTSDRIHPLFRRD